MNAIIDRHFTDEQIVTFGLIAIGVTIALAIGIFIQACFLRTLSRTLRLCEEENRRMQPWQVWLNLVPFFATIWIFFTVRRVAESLRLEFNDSEGEYSETLGYSYNALFLLGIIPYVGVLFSTAGFIGFIVYWTRISEHNAALKVKRGCNRMPKRESQLHKLPRFA